LELLQVPVAEPGAGVALTLTAVDPAGVVETHAGIIVSPFSLVNAGDTMASMRRPIPSRTNVVAAFFC
jgi:hypothetical protein